MTVSIVLLKGDTVMPLSVREIEAAIRSAKAASKNLKLVDGEGMYLRVRPAGGASWQMDYRFAGLRKTYSIGTFPEIGLSDARDKRSAAKKLLANGIDPSEQKRSSRAALAAAYANTFQSLSEQWHNRQLKRGLAPTSVEKARWHLRLLNADIGDVPISLLSHKQLLVPLHRAENRGRLATAHRLRVVMGQVYRFAIATGVIDRDPTTSLRGALATHVERHRAAITEPQSIGVLLRQIDAHEGLQPQTRIALHLLALLFPRPGELRQASWNEFDLDGAIWSIPAERMKMRRAHRVPLSRQAVLLLEKLKELNGSSYLLFPSTRSVRRPMSENTLNTALRTIGYSKEQMSAHGFRSIASTRLNEMGFNRDWIERQLAHQENNAVRRAYMNQAEWWDERCDMMQKWSDYLEALRRPRPILKVVDGG